MKKILAMAIGAAVVASFASAQTYSKNAVGFINIPATEGTMYALTFPLDNMESNDGLWNFNDTQLAKDAPDGSSVYLWNVADQSWDGFTKGRNGFPIPDDQVMLQPGQFFFFEPSADMTISMTGEVPDSTKTVVRIGKKQFSAIGNPYPTAMAFNDSALNTADIPDGSTVYLWSDESGWEGYTKGRNGFPIPEEQAVLQPGYGFFFELQSDDDVDWSVDKEYDWP